MSNPTNTSDPTRTGAPPSADKPDAAASAAVGAGASAGGGGVLSGSFRMDALSPGAAEGGGETLTAPRKNRVSLTGVFLAILVIGGAGILFVMRKIGIGPISALAQFKMPDYDVTKAPAAKSKDHDRIISDLTASHLSSQVPADQVQKNPFRLADALKPSEVEEKPTPGAKPDDDGGAAARAALEERNRRDADARKRMIESSLETMKIHQIMGGSNPIARIDNELVRIGDTLAELFTVKAISGRSVELECDGATYTISLDDQQTAKKPAPGPRPPKKK